VWREVREGVGRGVGGQSMVDIDGLEQVLKPKNKKHKR